MNANDKRPAPPQPAKFFADLVDPVFDGPPRVVQLPGWIRMRVPHGLKLNTENAGE